LRESSKIYIENNQQIERKIILQDQEITPLFDTPHLIKGIRNYRITKDLVGHFAHVARNLLLVEFTKIRGTQNFGRKQSYTYASTVTI
jgi:hypothetical protein